MKSFGSFRLSFPISLSCRAYREKIARCRRTRRGISVLAICASLLIVVLATLAAASTMVAMRATKAREQADADFARASAAIDDFVASTASQEDLQGFKMLKTRDAMLKPALAYYEAYVQAHANDEVPPLAVAASQFRIAGLHAKMGSNQSIPALSAGMRTIDKLRAAKVDPDTYPSMQDCAMGIAPPEEWIMLKGASMKEMQQHGGKLLFGITSAITEYTRIQREFPEAVGPRNELAMALGYSGALQSRIGRRKEGLGQLTQARMYLESLVRDRPNDTDFQTRLANICVMAGDIEKALKDNPAAIASYQKAVELRETLSAANPEDKALAAQLDAAKKQLEKLQSAAPAKVAAAPGSAEPAAATPPNDDSATQESDAAPSAEQPVADPASDGNAEDPAGDAGDEQPATP